MMMTQYLKSADVANRLEVSLDYATTLIAKYMDDLGIVRSKHGAFLLTERQYEDLVKLALKPVECKRCGVAKSLKDFPHKNKGPVLVVRHAETCYECAKMRGRSPDTKDSINRVTGATLAEANKRLAEIYQELTALKVVLNCGGNLKEVDQAARKIAALREERRKLDDIVCGGTDPNEFEGSEEGERLTG